MAAHQPVDEDNEDDETPYVYTSGIPSVGLPGGRGARSRSPLVISLLNNNPFETCTTPSIIIHKHKLSLCVLQTKNPPLRHPQAVAQPPANKDSDADYDESYTSGMPSIGLAGGRSMRPRTPLVNLVCSYSGFPALS